MTEDLISPAELLSDITAFTDEQRGARKAFAGLEFVLPREWMCEDESGVDVTAAGRVATGIYNTLVESGPADPRFREWDTWQMAASFADLIRTGGDALIWALIRIALDETSDEDFADLCESRGFLVRLPRRAGAS
jgi:hypothetical protein